MSEILEGKKVSAISLGCDKNRVDLERMLYLLRCEGCEIVENAADAQVVLVNTCAFITPAKKEALANIFEMCLLKNKGKLEKVLVSGCLAQRHKDELLKQIPEVDAFLVTSDNQNVCKILEGLYLKDKQAQQSEKNSKTENAQAEKAKVGNSNTTNSKNANSRAENSADTNSKAEISNAEKIKAKNAKGSENSVAKRERFGRIFTNRGSYAYLKIAEGCSNACSYCTIPRIKGRYVSFDADEIVDEAKFLAKSGVRELVIVAQDVTRYGEDLGKGNQLISLCKRLCKIDGVEWIRLHYAYPERTTKELLDFIETQPKMCKYLDIPLQHIDERILKSMRRHMNEKHTRELVREIREKHPKIALRTTFIVGYPGETRAEFKKLCNFLEEEKLEYAGFFPYYREENTPSYFMDGQISQFSKKMRLKKVQKIQNRIASQHAKENLGKIFRVLVDYFDENKGVFVGHSEFLSPTVDFGVEIADNGKIAAGTFVDVKYVDFDGENYKAQVVTDTDANNKK